MLLDVFSIYMCDIAIALFIRRETRLKKTR